MDGSPACPFVAFEDDRDERSTSPDHRHRCYAEDGAPAPRAAAHQEAYCLSSAFPVCPTFQAWARREAARAKTTEPSDRERDQRAMAGLSGADEWARSPEPHDADDDPIEATPRRNPPRDWAAPPPWAGGAGAARSGRRGRVAAARRVTPSRPASWDASRMRPRAWPGAPPIDWPGVARSIVARSVRGPRTRTMPRMRTRCTADGRPDRQQPPSQPRGTAGPGAGGARRPRRAERTVGFEQR